MEIHIHSVKAKSKAGNIRVKYIMITQKRPKPKENQLGILGISSRKFMLEIQQKSSSPGESAAGATYL